MGKVYNECNVQPSLSDPNYFKVLRERRKIQEDEPRPKVTFLEDTTAVANEALKGSTSSMFMKVQKKDGKSSSYSGSATDGKATRLEKEQLLDILFKLFETHTYWSLKGLKERTHQPEQYLKQVLDEIAILNKRGPYALKYQLKPENSINNKAEGDNSAGDDAGDNSEANKSPEEEEDDDDDENIELENVA